MAHNHRAAKTTLSPMDSLIGWVLILIAAVPRLYEALRLHSFTLYGDSIHYDSSGILILQRHYLSFWGYGPDAYVTPGYPLFLAFCYHLASHFSLLHTYAIHFTIVIQAVLSSIITGLMYWTSRRFLKPAWSIVAALLWISYPPAIWSITQILTETLYLFLLWLFVWTFVCAMEQKQVAWWATSGFVLGLCGLVRPTVFPLLAAVVIYGVVKLRESRSWVVPFRWCVAYAAGFLVALVPWWIRNFRLLHQVVLSDTEVGNPLLYGSDPKFAHDPGLGKGLSEIQQKQLAMQRIHEGLAHHPFATLRWYTAGKLDNLFGKPWYPPISPHVSAFFQFWVNIHLLWVIVGGVGILIGLVNPRMRLVSLFALFFVVVQLPFIPINRYAFPIMTMLFIGVGYVLQLAIRGQGRRRSRRYAS